MTDSDEQARIYFDVAEKKPGVSNFTQGSLSLFCCFDFSNSEV